MGQPLRLGPDDRADGLDGLAITTTFHANHLFNEQLSIGLDRRMHRQPWMFHFPWDSFENEKRFFHSPGQELSVGSAHWPKTRDGHLIG